MASWCLVCSFSRNNLAENILCVVFSHFFLSSPLRFLAYTVIPTSSWLGGGQVCCILGLAWRSAPFCAPWRWPVPSQWLRVYRDELCDGCWERSHPGRARANWNFRSQRQANFQRECPMHETPWWCSGFLATC